MSEKTCDLDYKAEYERLFCEREKYMSEAEYWHEIAQRAEKKAETLQAKMEVVELIFGGRCRKCNSQ